MAKYLETRLLFTEKISYIDAFKCSHEWGLNGTVLSQVKTELGLIGLIWKGNFRFLAHHEMIHIPKEERTRPVFYAHEFSRKGGFWKL